MVWQCRTKDSTYFLKHLSLNALVFVLISNNAVWAGERYTISPNVIITTLKQNFIPSIFQESSKTRVLLKLTQNTREAEFYPQYFSRKQQDQSFAETYTEYQGSTIPSPFCSTPECYSFLLNGLLPCILRQM